MRRATASIASALVAPASAFAHHPATSYAAIDVAWSYDPLVVIPLYLSALLYLVGTLRLWRRAGTGRGVRFRQAASFWTGWTFLALALVSPLHWLGEHLFTAHMLEHEILMVVAAPLLVLARPAGRCCGRSRRAGAGLSAASSGCRPSRRPGDS